mmetsp:Transcript_37627/g.94024  ORF Transcript_37627/g.94024 Transcript_37627/m.94024 type:complete len:246 (-) Transcript_37627:283-1020(-)
MAIMGVDTRSTGASGTSQSHSREVAALLAAAFCASSAALNRSAAADSARDALLILILCCATWSLCSAARSKSCSVVAVCAAASGGAARSSAWAAVAAGTSTSRQLSLCARGLGRAGRGDASTPAEMREARPSSCEIRPQAGVLPLTTCAPSGGWQAIGASSLPPQLLDRCSPPRGSSPRAKSKSKLLLRRAMRLRVDVASASSRRGDACSEGRNGRPRVVVNWSSRRMCESKSLAARTGRGEGSM